MDLECSGDKSIPDRKDSDFPILKNFLKENRFHDRFAYLCMMNSKALNILAQVHKLYQRYGIKSVTMDDVAKHLGISKKTLYEHFKDKEDLVRNVLMAEHDNQCGSFTAITDQQLNAIEELFEVYKMLNTMFREYNPSMEFDLRKYYPDLFIEIKEIRRKRMFESVMNNINKGKKEGLYRKELNSKIIAKLHVFRTESLFDNDMFTIEELTSFKMFHEVFIYHIQGILSHEGRSFFEVNFDKFKSSLSFS